MLAYAIRRLLLMIPTLFGITVILFCVIRLAPGDPATLKFGQAMGGDAAGMSATGSDKGAAMEKFRRKFHLDQPLPVQYGLWIADLARLDFGEEMFRPNVRIGEEMWKRLVRVTTPLALISVLLAYLIALPLGILSAVRQGTVADKTSTLFVFLLYSMPSFWAGLMLILLFGPTGLEWLPTMGLHDMEADSLGTWAYFKDTLWHGVLPVVTLTYGSFAYISRQMRVGMLDVIRQDYIRTATAKGLEEKVVVLKHAARNALIPVITLFATILPYLIGGSIIVESIFNIPGMGRYAFEALLSRDYNVIMATSTVVAVMTMLGFLLSDALYAVVDPRIAYD